MRTLKDFLNENSLVDDMEGYLIGHMGSDKRAKKISSIFKSVFGKTFEEFNLADPYDDPHAFKAWVNKNQEKAKQFIAKVKGI